MLTEIVGEKEMEIKDGHIASEFREAGDQSQRLSNAITTQALGTELRTRLLNLQIIGPS